MNPSSSQRRRGGLLFAAIQVCVSVAVTGFFGFMLFMLWEREAVNRSGVRRLGISPDLLTVTWVNYDQQMWIEQAGRRIGVYVLQVQRTEDMRHYELFSRVRMQTPVLGQTFPVRIDLRVNMNQQFEMETCQGVIDAAGQKLSLDAFVEMPAMFYRFTGPEMLLAGGVSSARVDLTDPIMMADAIRPVVTQSDRLKVGAKWTTIASDPITGRFKLPVEVEVVGIEELEIEGKPIKVFRVLETAAEKVTTSWYDGRGQVQKTDLGNGMVMIRALPDEVYVLHKELSLPPEFEEIPRAGIRSEAARAAPAGEGGAPLFPWMPKL